MKQPVIAIFDKKSGLYDRPFTCRHVADAVREWDIIRKDPETRIGKNPEDFELIEVAEFDCTTSKFEQLVPQRTLASGI